MRTIAVLILSLFSATAYSQSSIERFLDSTLVQLKTQYQTDKNDLQVFSLLESSYNEGLQSDKGELSPQTTEKLSTFLTDSKIKNKHLLILFLMYQKHITQTAAQGKRPNREYQLACINLLENEMLRVHNKVPTIVYIYKVEALQGAGLIDEVKSLIDESLKSFPNSIPLKVYKYLHTRDENVKRDLVQNHAQHWMVQQFGIK